MIDEVLRDCEKLANPQRANLLARYFKTGPGEYAEGDKFYGLTVPQVRGLVKKYFKKMQSGELLLFLQSDMHEERQMGLMMLVNQFRMGDAKTKEIIYNLYLSRDILRCINNWDLVDLSAPAIVGGYLDGKPKGILTELAKSKNLWERRIAILATFHCIGQKKPDVALRIAEILLYDKHDLIHKAVGWAIREVGKRCGLDVEKRFLNKYAAVMPRTMLRYAIERFGDRKRHYYLALRKI